MRPIFCGNFEYDARQSDLERLFGRYGKVDRVDMKSGEFSNWPVSVIISSSIRVKLLCMLGSYCGFDEEIKPLR